MAGNVFAKAVLELGASIGTFRSDLNQAVSLANNAFGSISNAASQLKGAIGVIGAGIGVGVFTNLIRDAIDAADHLNDLSKSTGVAVDVLGGIGFAAGQAGSDLDETAKSIGKLNLKIAEAKKGNEDAIKTFNALGISVDELNSKSTSDIFVRVAGEFEKYQDGANKAALGNAIFGKSYQSIIPLLDDGAASLEENINFYRQYGGVTAESAAQADRFNDSLGKLKVVADSVTRQFVGQLIPSLTNITEGMIEASDKTNFFTNAGKGIATFFEAIAVLGNDVSFVLTGIGKDLGALAAQAVAVAKLDFSQAGRIGELRRKDAEQARRDVDRANENILNPPKQASYSNEGRRFTSPTGTGERPEAPLISSGKTGSKSAKENPFKIALDAQLKALEQSISEEKSLLDDRNAFLDIALNNGLISYKEYFQGKANAQEENTAATLKAIDAEIAALTTYAATIKGKGANKERADNEQKIIDLTNKRAEVERKAATEGAKSFFAEQKAAKEYENQLRSLDAQLAELQGNKVEAVSIRFDIDHAKLKAELEAAGDFDGVVKLGVLRNFEIDEAAINELKDKIAVINENLRNSEAQVSLDVQLGAETELDSLERLSGLRQDAVIQLKEIAEQWAIIAENTDNPKIKQGLAEFNLSIDQLAANSDLLADKFEGIFKDAFADFGESLVEVGKGTKSLSDAFEDMADNIIAQISRIAAQTVAQDLSARIFGGGGGGGGGTGLIGDLLSIGASFFGGGPSAPAVRNLLFADGGTFDRGHVRKFADGDAFTNSIVTGPTNFNIGQMGEEGPEAVFPLTRDRNNKLAVKAVGGGQQSSVQMVFNINTPDANSFRKSQGQIMADANRALAYGRRNE